MDITEMLAPKSDQLDAVDLVAGPRTFTIDRVSRGGDEQPLVIHLVDFPRPWKPGVSMRRVLAAAWGTDASTWPGKRVKLFCDKGVMFGKEVVGGTRIAALSHIQEAQAIPLIVTRGKSRVFTIQPLNEAEEAPPSPRRTPTPEEIAQCVDVQQLRAMWSAAGPDLRKLITARVEEIDAEAPTETEEPRS